MLRPKRQSSSTITVTAPIGGWNAVTQLAAMSPNEAVVIDNWFCLPTELQVRKGYTEWATGYTGNIQSFINYSPASGTIKFFAAADNNGDCALYDVSSQNINVTNLVTESGDFITTEAGVSLDTNKAATVYGLTNAKFRFAQFANSGGHFTIAINDTDPLLLYDGTTWHEVNSTSTPYAITGVDTSSLNDVILHKRRVWFAEQNTLNGWYLDTDAVAGTAHKFDFGPLFAQGGSIAKLTTWTLDAGWGMDDYLVVLTTKGEVAVYKGVNPADSTDWSLQGVYYIGSPVGYYPTCKYGGDALLLNKDGLIPLSQCLMSSRVSTRISITNKIQAKVTQATSDYANNYGWQVILFPPQNMLMINVPTSDTTSDQYVMNTISGAWSRFVDVNATTWTFINEEMYFGSAGGVYKFWDGQSDNGSVVATDLLPAFSSFGTQSQIKRWSMARVSMGYDVSFSFSAQLSLDFDLVSQPPQPYNTLSSTAGIWDVGVWDQATWGGEIIPFARWQMASGMGHYGSYRIKTSSKTSDIRYYATDYVLEAGGVL